MQHPNLTHIDPTKIDFKLDIRDLSREIVITVRVNDDKLFTVLSSEATDLYKEAMDEFRKFKNENTNP